jgi:hypothetical protein
MTRLLSAGAKGAERMAHATGVDHALNQAVEEAIVRALAADATNEQIERAIENQEIRSPAILRAIRAPREARPGLGHRG